MCLIENGEYNPLGEKHSSECENMADVFTRYSMQSKEEKIFLIKFH
jgi:hypothetical protein